ncbi:MAG: LL-diaminopimelate aminotransferase [Planctomycetaceae bacterium]|jgi:LL-diaminopimelate aminotransferase|nr:LL-diaminopimelate aminotransferase [Planctomycetaceae bacterium]
MDNYFQSLFADRIGGVLYGKSNEIYKFEKIKRAKRQAIADFPDRVLLDFGIGENDAVADLEVRRVMSAEIDKVENRGYADNGCIDFKEAVARFMLAQFGVKLDAATEINHAIGSKPALAMLPYAFINQGDITLMTVPGYPVAGTHTKYCGGVVYNLPLKSENGFYPDFDSVPEDILNRAKLLVLNYPNSPTGQVATIEFYEKVIQLAKKYKFVVVQDAAHVMFTYRGKPLSFLQVAGAKDVGVEVHSLSKGWNMIGWRIAWVCGNELIVRAFADIKDNSDSGQFLAIQKAAIAALDNPNIPSKTNEKYLRRLRKLVETLRLLGFDCDVPGGTYFLYVKSPTGIIDTRQADTKKLTFATAEDASQYLIREHSICTVPWDNAGAYLRFSVTYLAQDENAEDNLMQNLIKRLTGIKFEF